MKVLLRVSNAVLIGVALCMVSAIARCEEVMNGIRNESNALIAIRILAQKSPGKSWKPSERTSAKTLQSRGEPLTWTGPTTGIEFELTCKGLSRKYKLTAPFPKERWSIQITDSWLPQRRKPLRKTPIKFDNELGQMWYDKTVELALKGNSKMYGSVADFLSSDGKHEEALEYLLADSDQGDTYAQQKIALKYLKGEGVERNFSRAIEYLKLAIEQGDAGAMYGLSLVLANPEFKGRNHRQSEKWLKRAAELDDTGAKRQLLYREYRKYPNHPASSVDRGRKAAALQKLSEIADIYDLKSAFARNRDMYILAVAEAYLKGYGVKKDFNKARFMFMVLDEKEHPEADLYLGDIYLRWSEAGKKYEGYRDTAIKHYEKARQAGVAGADDRLRAAKQKNGKRPSWTEDDTEKAIIIGTVVIGAFIFGSEMLKSKSANDGKQPPLVGKKFDELFHTTCRSCNGTGYHIGQQCPACKGYGYVD